MSGDKIYICDITSWQGQIGATHYYAKIGYQDSWKLKEILTNECGIFCKDEFELEYKIDIDDAWELDKKDGGNYYKQKINRGDIIKTKRFDSVEKIFLEATEWYKNNKIKNPLIFLFDKEIAKESFYYLSYTGEAIKCESVPRQEMYFDRFKK